MDYDNATDQEFFQSLKAAARRGMIGTFVRDKEKEFVVESSLEVFRKIVECDDVQFKGETPLINSVGIHISGKSIHVTDTELFGELLKIADTVEVTPLIDGTICVGVTYDNILKKVGEK